eukprot:1014606-Pelagomonas_calceolata.AAC.1
MSGSNHQPRLASKMLHCLWPHTLLYSPNFPHTNCSAPHTCNESMCLAPGLKRKASVAPTMPSRTSQTKCVWPQSTGCWQGSVGPGKLSMFIRRCFVIQTP